MKNALYYFLPVIAGMTVALQVLVNNRLQQATGQLWTIFVSHIGGAILALAAIGFLNVSLGKHTPISSFQNAPLWSMTGGFFGFAMVCCVLTSVRHLSLATVISLVIVGELLLSAVIDHYGAFGLRQVSFNGERIFGIALLCLGAYLIKL